MYIYILLYLAVIQLDLICVFPFSLATSSFLYGIRNRQHGKFRVTIKSYVSVSECRFACFTMSACLFVFECLHGSGWKGYGGTLGGGRGESWHYSKAAHHSVLCRVWCGVSGRLPTIHLSVSVMGIKWSRAQSSSQISHHDLNTLLFIVFVSPVFR